MSNTYRAKAGTLAAAHLGTEPFEREFTPSEEADWLAAGLELVPRAYRVVSNNYQVPQGEQFEAAFLVENEAALIAGGHIERVQNPPAKPARKR